MEAIASVVGVLMMIGMVLLIVVPPKKVVVTDPLVILVCGMDDYQQRAGATAVYKDIGKNPAYPALGLAEEAGEVVGKIKRMYRDDCPFMETREKVKAELGDVLWYVAAIANEFQLSLNDIAEANLEKVLDRSRRGVLKGSGDNR